MGVPLCTSYQTLYFSIHVNGLIGLKKQLLFRIVNVGFLGLELIEPALDVNPQLSSDLPCVYLNPTWQPHHFQFFL